jgi:pullulanase
MRKIVLSVVCVGAVVALCLVFFKLSEEPVRPAPARRAPAAAPGGDAPLLLEPLPEDIVFTPTFRAIPGQTPTWGIRYRNPAATKVMVSGSWDGWDEAFAMVQRKGVWELDLRPLKLGFGRHGFKFRPDGEWEKGENRALFISEEGLVVRPADLIFSATQETATRVDVYLRGDVERKDGMSVRIRQSDGDEVPIAGTKWLEGSGSSKVTGFCVVGDHVTFRMSAEFYGLDLGPSDRVSVAGSFNGWNANAGSQWRLQDEDGDAVWEMTIGVASLGGDLAKSGHEYKFVVNGSQWLRAPISAPNAAPDGKGNVNLRLDPGLSSSSLLQVETQNPLVLSKSYMLILEGLHSRPAYRSITPGKIMDSFFSRKELGATLDTDANRTIFRLFAPRASDVELCFYAGPEYRSAKSDELISPRHVHEMVRDDDGVWETVLPGLLTGTYYAFRVDGPAGPGEAFNRRQPIADPHSRAVAHARNASIVIDPNEENKWFRGWSDEAYRPPRLEDVVVYETHVRDLTIHASSGVEKSKRGRYAGVSASLGTGTGLDHLKRLGVNMIEFLPISEFENGTFDHAWGYNPAFYNAPEASYGSDPLKGSQYYEFKALVDALHAQGFGVLLDVVYNHLGTPNVFHSIDRKYYFRQDHEFVFSNFSGCGNDFRTEGPMTRRFIVDSILYWMREHHVDGFRFDLCELIDMETIHQIEKEARALNPDVILISEPWSFRGNHKQKLKGTGWSAWNNDFREPVKHFVTGHGDREAVVKAIRGSVDLWTARPLQSVNYLESHDDMCLTDELSDDPQKDGSKLTEALAARSRLGATLIFTSLGIPMIAEGQEFLRSKLGIHNTYNHGDRVNALQWKDRDRPLAKLTQEYYAGLVRLRASGAGRAFKLGQSVPGDHYRWIRPHERSALGYVVNADKRAGDASFVVLVNACKRTVGFDVEFPAGEWVMAGDGRQIDERGIPGKVLPPVGPDGSRHVKVPKLSSQIFMSR